VGAPHFQGKTVAASIRRSREGSDASAAMTSTKPSLRAAHAAFFSGDLATAIALCREILAVQPDTAGASQMLAMAQARSGDLPAAIQTLDAAIERLPGEPKLRVSRAEVRRALARLDGAEADLRAVLAARRDLAVVFSLAEVLQAQKKFPEARALYQEILALYPEEPAALCNLGTIEADIGDAERAIALYKAALRHDPALAGAETNLALLEFGAVSRADTVDRLRRALALAPGNVLVHAHLALAHRLAGDPEAAARAYAAARGLDATLADALQDTHDHALTAAAGSTVHGDRLAVMRAAFGAAEPDGLVLEFGVYRGTSLRFLASAAAGTVHGFDSFEGLPEAWTERDPAGQYRVGRRPEDLPDNVELHVGLFEETLPGFVAERSGPVRLLHVDCDLYASTVVIFQHLAPRVRAGSVIVFDEYFGYADWRRHEFRAFQEVAAKHGWRYRYVAVNPFGKQAAVRVTAIGS